MSCKYNRVQIFCKVCPYQNNLCLERILYFFNVPMAMGVRDDRLLVVATYVTSILLHILSLNMQLNNMKLPAFLRIVP